MSSEVENMIFPIIFPMSKKDLIEITEIVLSRLKNPPKTSPIRRYSSGQVKLLKNGHSVADGWSEFWCVDGRTIRVTWTLTYNSDIVHIDWETDFSADQTIPNTDRKAPEV